MAALCALFACASLACAHGLATPTAAVPGDGSSTATLTREVVGTGTSTATAAAAAACVTCNGSTVEGVDCSWVYEEEDGVCVSVEEALRHLHPARPKQLELAEQSGGSSANTDEIAYMTGLQEGQTKTPTAEEWQSLSQQRATCDIPFVYEIEGANELDANPSCAERYLPMLKDVLDKCQLPSHSKVVVMLGDHTEGGPDSKHISSTWTDNRGHTYQTGIPVLAKARRVADHAGGLLPLNTGHHWLDWDSVSESDIPFSSKSDAIIWRGGKTGLKDESTNVRVRYVKALASLGMDVKFVELDPNHSGSPSTLDPSKHLGSRLSRAEMLQSKYLLALEGNDVATSMQWMLNSNSVVVMPTPTKETYHMLHGKLEKWLHYVPLDEPEKAQELLSTLKNKGDDWHLNIIHNANEWVKRRRNMVDDPAAACLVAKAHAEWYAKAMSSPASDKAKASTGSSPSSNEESSKAATSNEESSKAATSNEESSKAAATDGSTKAGPSAGESSSKATEKKKETNEPLPTSKVSKDPKSEPKPPTVADASGSQDGASPEPPPAADSAPAPAEGKSVSVAIKKKPAGGDRAEKRGNDEAKATRAPPSSTSDAADSAKQDATTDPPKQNAAEASKPKHAPPPPEMDSPPRDTAKGGTTAAADAPAAPPAAPKAPMAGKSKAEPVQDSGKDQPASEQSKAVNEAAPQQSKGVLRPVKASTAGPPKTNLNSKVKTKTIGNLQVDQDAPVGTKEKQPAPAVPAPGSDVSSSSSSSTTAQHKHSGANLSPPQQKLGEWHASTLPHRHH